MSRPSLLRALWNDAVSAATSLLFPAPCRICETTLLNASRIPICEACLESIAPLAGHACHCCGRPIVSGVAAAAAPRLLCHACRRGVYAFDAARSYAPYDDTVHKAVVLLKYHAVAPLGRWFAARLATLVAREPDLFAADAVVPVPLDKQRFRERGYNQAELIAQPLGKLLRLPLRPALLLRRRPRPAHLRLSRHERWTSVRGAYEIREGSRVDKLRLLLVDDVFTTGATLDACARALREGGAAGVVGITVARVVSPWMLSGPVPRGLGGAARPPEAGAQLEGPSHASKARGSERGDEHE